MAVSVSLQQGDHSGETGFGHLSLRGVSFPGDAARNGNGSPQASCQGRSVTGRRVSYVSGADS